MSGEFILGGIDFIGPLASHIGASDLGFSTAERLAAIPHIEAARVNRWDTLDRTMLGSFSNADPSDTIYHDFRHGTRKGLVLGSVGVGVVRVGLSAIRAAWSSTPFLLPKNNLSGNTATATRNIETIAVKETAKKASRNHFTPDINATGAHTVFRRDPITNKVTHYETYRPQTNPFDPKPWESVKRFDGVGSDPHFNKITRENIGAPHVHDPSAPGGLRPPQPWEIP